MTIKQRQHLLAFLGYYVGSIDGIWGQLSRVACSSFQKDFGLTDSGSCDTATEKAMKHAVCYGMPTKAENAPASGDFWDNIKYFRKAEFACKCGCGASDMEEKLVRTADMVREYFGSPITVSSGRRCAKHNASASVKGVSNSRHLSGKAMDFCVRGLSATMVLDYVQKLPEIRYSYAIDSNFVHMDVE